MNNANNTENDSNDYTIINTQESEQIEPKEISKSVKASEPTESEHVVEANFDKVRDIIKSNSSNTEDTIEQIPDEIELAPDEEEVHLLDDPSKGLYIGPYIWREMFDFAPNSTLLVLASHEYDENDYFRDYKEYEKEYILTRKK